MIVSIDNDEGPAFGHSPNVLNAGMRMNILRKGYPFHECLSYLFILFLNLKELLGPALAIKACQQGQNDTLVKLKLSPPDRKAPDITFVCGFTIKLIDAPVVGFLRFKGF